MHAVGLRPCGTERYCSLNTQAGLTPSRRDDLESVGFLLIYFLKGKLPWQGLPAQNMMEKSQKIMQVKEFTTLEELCEDLPKEFYDYTSYIRKLYFEDEPDYKKLIQMFQNAL